MLNVTRYYVKIKPSKTSIIYDIYHKNRTKQKQIIKTVYSLLSLDSCCKFVGEALFSYELHILGPMIDGLDMSPSITHWHSK